MADKEVMGVDDLAKYMKKSPSAVRGLLRRSKIKRSGKSYEFSSKTALQAAAKKLGHEPKSSKPAKKKKSADDRAAA